MRWVVALGLRGRSRGALELAVWLKNNAPSGDPDHLLGCHVAGSHESVGLVERALDDVVVEHAGAHAFEAIRVVEGDDPAQCLEDVARAHDADALLIGRRGVDDQTIFSRLGRVATRLAQTAYGPLIVVPPSLRSGEIEAGPIVCAVDLHDDMLAAVAFSRHWADRYRRPLRLVHVVRSVAAPGLSSLPAVQQARVAADLTTQAKERVARWASQHDLGDLPIDVLQGEIVEALVHHAAKLEAFAIAVGARQVSRLARLFLVRVGAPLAASAPCPVAIIPPSSPAASQ